MSDQRIALVQRLRRQLAERFPPDSTAGRNMRRGAVAMIDAARAVTQPLSLLEMISFQRHWRGRAPGIGQQAAGRRIVMLVVSDVHIDPRVRQEAITLAAAGFNVVVMWPELASKIGQPIDWGPGISFERLAPHAGAFAYRFPGVLGRVMLDAALAHKPLAFHGHDLPTSLIALTAARKTGAHAVCDFHEWFSEHVTWSNRQATYVPMGRTQSRINKRMERFAFDRASAIVTVCHSIAEAMDTEYGDGSPKVHVIRNISGALANDGPSTYPSLRGQLGLRDNQQLVLYQGGIGPSRALEPVIAALAHAPEIVLAIRGPSIEHFTTHYRAVAAAAGIAPERLALLPPVPSADVVAACNGADVGLYTVAGLCKSFTHALPNKVFEYMRANLPVLTADYPEVRRMVVDTGAGIAFDPSDPQSIAAAMRQFAASDRRATCAAAGRVVLRALDAAPEWPKLVHLYERLAANEVQRDLLPVGREPLPSQRQVR